MGLTGGLLMKPVRKLSQLKIDSNKNWSGYTTALSQNLLPNFSFEEGSPIGSNWTNAEGTWNLGGAGASWSKSTLRAHGLYSARIANSAGNEAYCEVHPTPLSYYSSRTFTMAALAYATVPNRVCLNMYDNNGSGYQASQSTYHPGDGAWHWLTLTRTNRASLTDFIARCRISAGSAIEAYFDKAFLIETPNSFVEPFGISNLKTLGTAVNIVRNGCFEVDNPICWTAWGGASLTRDSTHVHSGAYAARVTGGGFNTGIYQPIGGFYVGKTITVGCWVWADAPNFARITTWGGAYSPYHPGDSQWHYLTVTNVIQATEQNLYCITDDNVHTAWFDDYVAITNEVLPGDLFYQYNDILIGIRPGPIGCNLIATDIETLPFWGYPP